MIEKCEKKDIDKLVSGLIKKMSLYEKLGQIQCLQIGRDIPEDLYIRFPHGVGEAVAFGGKESIEANVEFAKKIQNMILVNKNKIPAILHCEAVTGLNLSGGTIFPSAIGLGASWNPDTVFKMAGHIRKQMLAVGLHHALSPVMDVARDPRWGRVGETYGEDPTLCSAMCVAFTRGLQGGDYNCEVIATGKHFMGYGFSEGGLNMAANPIPERELREVYAKPFQAAITEAGLGSIMNSYGSIDGELVIVSEKIMSDILRDEMGFDGIVVSDYMSINKVVQLGVYEDAADAGMQALKAGLDIELPAPYGYTEKLVAKIEAGELSESAIDAAVSRVLKIKFRLGLFDNPYPREELLEEAYSVDAGHKASLKAAHESIVLVKNTGILPLKKDKQRIAVIGPHADSIRLLFGCYTYPALLDMFLSGSMSDMAGVEDLPESSEKKDIKPQKPKYEGSNIIVESEEVTGILNKLFKHKTPTILQAIKAKNQDSEIVYSKGCEIAGTNKEYFDDAVKAAENADVVILTLGGKYGWGNNCTTGEGIDTDRIGLPGVQEELVKVIHKTGVPVVVVHMDAKPLSSEFISEKIPAIIENWFPGETGGQALADVLFGDYNPAGRLPVTVARNAGQIPIYMSHRRGGGYSKEKGMVLSKYVEGTKQPLHYLGEGCSYTEFEYSNLQLDNTVRPDQEVTISCEVKNSGTMDGEEVVQLYIADEIASMIRPNKELAGFIRIPLKVGEKKKVEFRTRVDQLAFLDTDMNWIVEKGWMSVMIGGSSEDIRLTGKYHIADSAFIDGRNRGFYSRVGVR